MYNVYLLQCLGAKHAGCRSATVQAFVFIQHVTINMVWISGVARYWLPIRILLPYLWLHFRHHCLWWDKFGFPERTLCFIAVIKSRDAFSRTVRWKMSIPLKTSIIIIIDDSDSWFYNDCVHFKDSWNRYIVFPSDLERTTTGSMITFEMTLLLIKMKLIY